MFGAAMRGPTDGSPAHAREAALLTAFELGPGDFQPLRNIAEGTRRHATIIPGDPTVETVGDDAVRVTFTLPAGAYATAVMREVQKLGETESAPWI
jgi:tRNA(Glu) U13 pseudouridine synthase TruD